MPQLDVRDAVEREVEAGERERALVHVGGDTCPACRDASSAWIPFPVPTSSARRTGRRTVRLASVFEGPLHAGNVLGAGRRDSVRSDATTRSSCGISRTAATMRSSRRTTRPSRSSPSTPTGAKTRSATSIDSLASRTKTRIRLASGALVPLEPAQVRREVGRPRQHVALRAEPRLDRRARVAGTASTVRSAATSSGRAAEWSAAGSAWSRSAWLRLAPPPDTLVRLQVPAGRRLGADAALRVLLLVGDLDLREVEGEGVVGNGTARVAALLVAADEAIGELVDEELDLRRSRPCGRSASPPSDAARSRRRGRASARPCSPASRTRSPGTRSCPVPPPLPPVRLPDWLRAQLNEKISISSLCLLSWDSPGISVIFRNMSTAIV